MTLTEFLLARIAEDEAAVGGVLKGERILRLYCDDPAHWDDRRVLAECEVKRRIVEHHIDWAATLTQTPVGWSESAATAYRMAMTRTVTLLALPYADHPDYQQEWAL